MSEQGDSTKILDVALKALQTKNPDIVFDKKYKTHDAFHLIGCAAFDGDLSDIPPFLGIGTKKELLVNITQTILFEPHKIYNSKGDYIESIQKDHTYYNDLISSIKHQQRDDNIIISEEPLTVAEMRKNLEKLYVTLMYNSFDSEDAKKEKSKKLQERTSDGKLNIGITDQAIEYYIERALLIKQKLKNAGISSEDLKNPDEINAIDPQVFVVTKEDVINRLKNKHGVSFSINTEIPNNNISSNTKSIEPLMTSQAQLIR